MRPFLPIPCPVFGFYQLPDGSRIYPSGSAEFPVRPGKFMAWVCTGERASPSGSVHPDGRFLLEKAGVRYFDSPVEAQKAIIRERRGRLAV